LPSVLNSLEKEIFIRPHFLGKTIFNGGISNPSGSQIEKISLEFFVGRRRAHLVASFVFNRIIKTQEERHCQPLTSRAMRISVVRGTVISAFMTITYQTERPTNVIRIPEFYPRSIGVGEVGSHTPDLPIKGGKTYNLFISRKDVFTVGGELTETLLELPLKSLAELI
jgi:hypothetical protein